jgi:hypothetical protein
VAKEEKTAAALFAKLKFLQQREKNTLMKWRLKRKWKWKNNIWRRCVTFQKIRAKFGLHFIMEELCFILLPGEIIVEKSGICLEDVQAPRLWPFLYTSFIESQPRSIL